MYRTTWHDAEPFGKGIDEKYPTRIQNVLVHSPLRTDIGRAASAPAGCKIRL